MCCCCAKVLSASASAIVKTSLETSFWPIIGVAPSLVHTVASLRVVPAAR